MKIGELFVALGFQIKGQAEFDEVENSMKKATMSAGKFALAVDIANLALFALLESATKMAVGFKNFALQTALSTEELQRWQHIAAVNNVAAEELTSTVKGLQDTRAAFALGEPQAVGAWSLLGIDPTQDPFQILTQLRTRLREFADVGIARNLAQKVGISDNVFQMLVASNAEFEKWNRQFELTRSQTDTLRRLDNAWRDLRFEIAAVKAQFASALAPVLEKATTFLAWMAKGLAVLTGWLTSASTMAKMARTALAVLAVTLVAVGVAATAVAGVLAAIAAGFAVLSPAVLVTGAALLPIIGYASAIAAVLIGLGLVIDDIISSLSGNKAVTRQLGEWLTEFKAIYKVIEGIWYIWDKITQARAAGQRAFEGLFEEGINRINRNTTLLGGSTETVATGPARRGSTGGASTVVNDIDVHIDGARDPQLTGSAVVRSLRQEINDARYQAPATNR